MAEPTLLRAQDGTMYFIPPADLESYRLPEEQARDIQQKLEESEGSEVAGFSFDQNLTPQKLGIAGAASMDNSPTRVGSLL